MKNNVDFDIDLFVQGDKIYLNEINFRNGALSYSLVNLDVSIALEWINSNEKNIFKSN